MSFRRFTFALLLVGAALFGPASASAELPSSSVRYLDDGVQRITYRIGPIDVTPGQNRIAYRPLFGAEKPAVDGWLTRLKPDLVNEDGSVPLSSKVMFHHGVWLNLSRKDATTGSFERFYATGEEKTITSFPQGFGYQYKASDTWLLNHMIHNLTPQPMKLYATYTVDFIPAGTPAAEGMKAVTPIWMDVENGGIYPVFASSADTPVPMVATSDIGQVAARTLQAPPATSESVDLIGPAYSEREVAAMLGDALGRELHVATLPEDAWPAVLRDAGFPPHVAASLAELYRADGHGLLAPRGDRGIRVTTTLDATLARLLAA